MRFCVLLALLVATFGVTCTSFTSAETYAKNNNDHVHVHEDTETRNLREQKGVDEERMTLEVNGPSLQRTRSALGEALGVESAVRNGAVSAHMHPPPEVSVAKAKPSKWKWVLRSIDVLFLAFVSSLLYVNIHDGFGVQPGVAPSNATMTSGSA